MGPAIDRSREVASRDPSYRQRNQWLFLKMPRRRHRRNAANLRSFNWGIEDQTVPAKRTGGRRPWLAQESGVPSKSEILATTEHLDLRRRVADFEVRCAPLAGLARARSRCRRTGSARAKACASPSARHHGQLTANRCPTGACFVHDARRHTMGVTFCAVAPEHALLHVAASDRRSPRSSPGSAGGTHSRPVP
jgi:leucyl-tRNA synthetase